MRCPPAIAVLEKPHSFFANPPAAVYIRPKDFPKGESTAQRA
jgi:hypothetical protein